LRNFHISEYKNVSYNKPEPMRDRKLLLTKKELTKLKTKIKNGGLTIIPLKIFINEKGLVKFDIGLAKGKKDYDKKDTIKNRDMKRSEDRCVKF
jgi:SsrA-binding protein